VQPPREQERAGRGRRREPGEIADRVNRHVCVYAEHPRQPAAHVQHVFGRPGSPEVLERPHVTQVVDPDRRSEHDSGDDGARGDQQPATPQQPPLPPRREIQDEHRHELRFDRQHEQPRAAGPGAIVLGRSVQAEHRERQQDRRLSLFDRAEHRMKREHGERDHPALLPVGAAPRRTQAANQQREYGDRASAPDHERSLLAGTIGKPADRRARQRGMRRVEERHQPAFEMHAVQQCLLRRTLRRFVVERRGTVLQDQRPAGPEHGEVADQRRPRRRQMPNFAEGKAGGQAAVDDHQRTERDGAEP
jgi:hypothetical protein